MERRGGCSGIGPPDLPSCSHLRFPPTDARASTDGCAFESLWRQPTAHAAIAADMTADAVAGRGPTHDAPQVLALGTCPWTADAHVCDGTDPSPKACLEANIPWAKNGERSGTRAALGNQLLSRR